MSPLSRISLVAVLGLATQACAGARVPSPNPGLPGPAADAVNAHGAHTVQDRAPAADEASRASHGRSEGILVMAHGGNEEWNAAVSETVARLQAEAPTALAFGMANRVTLEAALDSLSDQGVERVSVVRMFLSGESFREQTDYFLGLSPERPRFFISHGGHGGHDGHDAEPTPIEHGLAIATHDAGIMNSREAARIMVDRAQSASMDPSSESVLVLAHGMGDEARNDAVLAAMEAIRPGLTDAGFAGIKLATLREDWPEAREASEADIRAWMATQAAEGRNVIVVPYRLQGFGPYAEVLEGFSYARTDGLLPHPLIAEWGVRTWRQVSCAQGWAAAGCGIVAEQASENF